MAEKHENSNHIKEVFKIKGMTCSSCSLRIEIALKKLKGIISVKASYPARKAAVIYDKNKTDRGTVIKEIQSTGYDIDTGETSGNNSKIFNIGLYAGTAAILLVLWLLISKTGLINMLPQITSAMGYPLLFIAGVLTSLHCIAMCGGINLSQSVNKEENTEKRLSFNQFVPGLLYNSGRVISYTIIGGIAGAVGSAFNMSGKIQGIIVIIAALFMIMLALNMMGLFPWLSLITPRIPKFMGKILKGRLGNRGPFIVGLLNGLMPCGPLQSMQIYALGTGNFISGALSMFLFSLGTVPLMTGFGALGALLTKKFAARMVKVSAMIILLLGFGMAIRGLSLSGISIKPVSSSHDNISVIRSGVQYAQSIVTNSAFEPVIVQKGIPVKWNLKAKKEELNGCNNAITIPEFNITKKLYPGDNIVEFTPENSGNITFTCWMGMISSTIKVVDDINKIDAGDIASINNNDKSGSSGCCSLANSPADYQKIDPVVYFRLTEKSFSNAVIKDGIQYAAISADGNGYSPNIIILQKGIKTKWIINGKNLNDINYRLIVPAYNARIELKQGENSVDFVPETDFVFDSWKGSYHGYMAVVDNIGTYDGNDIKARLDNFTPVPANAQQGGCCGK